MPTDSYRTSRAAGENIIPADTNSAEIITQVLPELEDKLAVVALNVPVVDGSTVDMVVDLEPRYRTRKRSMASSGRRARRSTRESSNMSQIRLFPQT